MVASNPFVLPLKQQLLGGFDYNNLANSAGIPPELRDPLVRFMRAVDEEKQHTTAAQWSTLEKWAFGSLRLTEVQASVEPTELGQIEAKLLHVATTTDSNGWIVVPFEKPFSTALVGAVSIAAEASGANTNHVLPDLGAGTQSTKAQARFRLFGPTGVAAAVPTACRFVALVFGW